jgi:hypothetical protein
MEGTDSKLLEGLMMHSCCSLMVFASRAPPTFRTIQRLCHMFGPKIGIDRVASRKNMFVGNPSFKYLPCWPKKKTCFLVQGPGVLAASSHILGCKHGGVRRRPQSLSVTEQRAQRRNWGNPWVRW